MLLLVTSSLSNSSLLSTTVHLFHSLVCRFLLGPPSLFSAPVSVYKFMYSLCIDVLSCQRERERERESLCVYIYLVLPGCSFTGSGHYTRLSPYVQLSNFSLKVCTLIADTTSSLMLFLDAYFYPHFFSMIFYASTGDFIS